MVPAKILAVDQDHSTYESFKGALSRRGYEMHTTSNMDQALTLSGAHAYAAALISATLLEPRFPLDTLLAEMPQLPIILTIFPEQTCLLPPYWDQVVCHVLGKPLMLESVCLVLDRTLELATLRAQLRRQRQEWGALHHLRSTSEDGESPTEEPLLSLSEALVYCLRGIVPDLGRLGGGSLHHMVLSHVEKLLLSIVLDECRGNQVKSAEILGINRNTLRKRLRDFDLLPPRHSP